jgi:hypothetical protein
LSRQVTAVFLGGLLAAAATPAGAAANLYLSQHTLDQARQQLASGPPPDLIIAEPVRLTQQERWIVKDIRFEGNGVLYLQQYDLDLTVQGEWKLRSNARALFASFAPDNQKARDGANGTAGDDGLPGGVLTLHLRKAPERPVPVDLQGQSGGNGGNGGNGSAGLPGQGGRAAKSGVFNCVLLATPGGSGGRGGNGGDAGPGGACGRGGVLRIDGGRLELFPFTQTFVPQPGQPGRAGKGGPGGAPGPGGPGGGFCSGSPSGQPGPAGNDGRPARGGASCTPPGRIDLRSKGS